MEKVHILGTGLQGLVGSQLTNTLRNNYTFTNLSRSTGVDITDKEQITRAVSTSSAAYVLHLAAKADVDGCERDKAHAEQGEAWRINVQGTRNIAEACKASGKLLLYISTDFVFDGKKGNYAESDAPNAVNWYGKTKLEGENAIKDSGCAYVLLRIAYPYGQAFAGKKDFVQAILSRLQTGQEVAAVTDHIFTPTYIPDIALAIDALITHQIHNETYHIVGSQQLTPFAAAGLLADLTPNDVKHLIRETTREVFFAGRAERPYNLSLKNDKITGLGVNMRGFAEGLQELPVQR